MFLIVCGVHGQDEACSCYGGLLVVEELSISLGEFSQKSGIPVHFVGFALLIEGASALAVQAVQSQESIDEVQRRLYLYVKLESTQHLLLQI